LEDPIARHVEFLAKILFEDLPTEVVQQAKYLILDSIGCAIGGARTTLGMTVAETIRGLGGKPESTIIGYGGKTNCVLAAHVNAILIDALDFEDTFHGLGHPSATIIPAALAVAERQGANGRRLITAVIGAYEVALRLGFATRPCSRKGKFGSFQYWHGFGAAAAASKILELDIDGILAAFGYAGASSPLPMYVRHRPRTWIKDNFGEITAGGVLGALLAQRGFIAPRAPDLDFWREYKNDQERYDIVVNSLGDDYKILLTGFKPFTACRFVHAALGALQTIMRENKISASQIRNVIVHSHHEVATDFAVYEPRNMVDAEFSLPYTAAMVMLGRKPGLDWYSDEALKDSVTLEQARKIRIEYSEESDRLLNEEDYRKRRSMAVVEVVTADGRHYEKRVEAVKGDPGDPLTRAELVDKFRDLARSAAFERDKVETIIRLVTGLESLDDIRKLGELLSP